MKLNQDELKTLCRVGEKAAKEAGVYIQSQFDQHYVKQKKEGGDSLASQVVTEVDIEAQRIILHHLQAGIKTYDLGLLTEELEDDDSRKVKDYFWCIDPMDGTLPFTEQRTGYAVSIALITREGNPVIGVVYIPDLEECFSAVKGQGLWLNQEVFQRDVQPENHVIHIYWDSSFKSESYFQYVVDQLGEYASQNQLGLQYHLKFGGVRNAMGVMQSGLGCYFKFPKNRKGCGSIWDYAATRLFLEELELYVSNTQGKTLALNNSSTTFMNDVGILYATDETLARFITVLGSKVKSRFSEG